MKVALSTQLWLLEQIELHPFRSACNRVNDKFGLKKASALIRWLRSSRYLVEDTNDSDICISQLGTVKRGELDESIGARRGPSAAHRAAECRVMYEGIDGFWDRATPTHNCWIWKGSRPGRYGTVTAFGEKLRSHRVAYILANGVLVGEKVVCHRCDNPQCVRPEHLFLGTPQANHDDMKRKGRGPKTTSRNIRDSRFAKSSGI